MSNISHSPTTNSSPSPISSHDDNHASSDSSHSAKPQRTPRVNDWHGTPRQWRHLTHEERALAASLDRLEADDLSAHLYNAHCLKRRAYKQHGAEAVKSWQTKKAWVQAGKWVPAKSWTAWPMAPAVVPRESEGFSGGLGREWEDGRIVRKEKERWKPSGFMEEMVLAAMTRIARERFVAREWEDDEGVEGDERGGKRRKVDAGGPMMAADLLSDDAGGDASSGITDGSQSDGSASDSDVGVDEEFGSEEQLSEPVVLADDDRARSILQPSIRHVLRKLDDILIGLHRSRQNHINPGTSRSGASSGGESEDDLKDASRTGSTLDERKSRSASKARRSRSTASRGSSHLHRGGSDWSKQHVGLRDWSEVLGIAAMVGWNPAVIQRARSRCAELFGEDMAFAVLHESLHGGQDNGNNTGSTTEEADRPSLACSTDSEAESRSTAEASEDEMHGGVHVDGYLKPIPSREAGRKRRAYTK